MKSKYIYDKWFSIVHHLSSKAKYNRQFQLLQIYLLLNGLEIDLNTNNKVGATYCEWLE